MEWMDLTLFTIGDNPTDALELIVFVASVAAVFLTALGVRYLLRGRLTFLDESDRLVASRFVYWVLVVFGLMTCLGQLGINMGAPLLAAAGFQVSVLDLVTFVSFVATVLIGSNLARKLTEERLLTQLEPGARYAVARLLYYILLSLGLLAAMQTLGLELSSLTVAVGALSVGIGFGLQNIVNNFVSGLILLFERPIQVGDWIEVEGTSGRITQIGARSTTVVTNDNITILVPNASCLSTQVINWSHGDSRVRIRLPLGVAYGSDMDKVVKVLLEVASRSEHVLGNPEPTVLFNEFGDSSLNLELAVWIDIRHAAIRRVRSDLNFAVNRAFAEAGIEIPFPQRDLHFRSGEVQVAGPAGP